MGVSAGLRRFAFARPTAFPVIGWDGEEPLLQLVRSGLVQPVGAPHDSDLMVLSGRIPATWSGPLSALFETLALPRLAVWLRPEQGAAAPAGLPLLELDPERPDRAALLRRLLDPDAPNNCPVLPDEPPARWRGEGDHGQGGEGMMGGKPYGRPMAMVGADPDGLMLGALPTSLGPFFPGLPSGLQEAQPPGRAHHLGGRSHQLVSRASGRRGGAGGAGAARGHGTRGAGSGSRAGADPKPSPGDGGRGRPRRAGRHGAPLPRDRHDRAGSVAAAVSGAGVAWAARCAPGRRPDRPGPGAGARARRSGGPRVRPH